MSVEAPLQLSLPDLQLPELSSAATIGERFAAFHGARLLADTDVLLRDVFELRQLKTP